MMQLSFVALVNLLKTLHLSQIYLRIRAQSPIWDIPIAIQLEPFAGSGGAQRVAVGDAFDCSWSA